MIYRYLYRSSHPDQLLPRVIYLICEEEEEPYLAVFLCPCGCKQLVHLNLMPVHPYWKLGSIDKDDTVTFSPSIQRTIGCKSHFYIKKGKVEWA